MPSSLVRTKVVVISCRLCLASLKKKKKKHCKSFDAATELSLQSRTECKLPDNVKHRISVCVKHCMYHMCSCSCFHSLMKMFVCSQINAPISGAHKYLQSFMIQDLMIIALPLVCFSFFLFDFSQPAAQPRWVCFRRASVCCVPPPFLRPPRMLLPSPRLHVPWSRISSWRTSAHPK